MAVSVLRTLGPLVLAALLLAPGARAAEPYEQRLPVAPGGRLEVHLDRGDIEIEGHAEDEIRIAARTAGAASRGVDFEIEQSGNDVRLSADFGALASIFARVRVRIWVPERFDLEIRSGGGSVDVAGVQGEMQIETSGGDIRLERSAGEIELQTSGGAIRMHEVGGSVEARSSGGPIRGSEIRGAVEAETSGGPIDLKDVGGPIEAKTSGGSIEVRFTGPPAGQLETSGGGIDVEFPASAGVDLQAESRGGHIDLEREIVLRGEREATRVEGEINGGGGELELRTSGGNIRIRVR